METIGNIDVKSLGLLALQMKEQMRCKTVDNVVETLKTVGNKKVWGLQHPERCSDRLLDFLELCLNKEVGPKNLMNVS